jgi:hypothetical protein
MATDTKDPDDTLNDEQRYLKRDYYEDITAHDDAIRDFDAYEAMASSQVFDEVTRTTKSGLTDSATSTLYLERAARVAGQLPEGEVQAFGKKDIGKGLLMDLLRRKWIYPNANAQHPFRTKMFLWQYGSSEYGFMPMYYDLHYTATGKTVIDCWLWNPRNFIPQNGLISINEMEYCHGIAMKTPRYLEDLLDEPDSEGWDKKAIRESLDSFKSAQRDKDSKRDTLTSRQRSAQSARQIQVATRYEAGKKGKWVTFLPDYGYKVLRRIRNPHKNGRIPFVVKPCIPSWDTFYNVSDFQRSKPMQFANDGLDNFYFEGIKMNLFPPTVVNANGIVKHTVKQEAGAIWMETQPNSARRLETSTAGLATYQAAKGMAKGAIQSIAGTTETNSNAQTAMDPSFGKTPQALKQQQQRESTRDNQDRELLEEAMVDLIEGMISIIPTMMTEDIPVDMFSKEIEEIFQSGYVDVMQLFEDEGEDPEKAFEKFLKKAGADMTVSDSGQQARLTISPSKLKGAEYKFLLDPNSTAKSTKDSQKQSLVDFLGFVGQLPNALQQYQQATNRVPNWEKIFEIYGNLSDVPGLDDIFMDAAPQPAAAPPGQPGMADAGMPPDQMGAQAQQSGGGTMVAGMQFNDPALAARAQQLEALKSGGQQVSYATQ